MYIQITRFTCLCNSCMSTNLQYKELYFIKQKYNHNFPFAKCQLSKIFPLHFSLFHLLSRHHIIIARHKESRKPCVSLRPPTLTTNFRWICDFQDWCKMYVCLSWIINLLIHVKGSPKNPFFHSEFPNFAASVDVFCLLMSLSLLPNTPC